MNKLIVIIGPTCSKKNSLAKILAKEFSSYIVNADPFQTYKELNIGVNKPSVIELNNNKYFFINNNSIFDEWDVSIFQNKFYELYQKINDKPVILCGGSHMYIDSIVKGYNFIKANLNELEKELNDNYTNEMLFDYIQKHDYQYSLKISINNRRRLIRSVALMKSLNKTMTEISNGNNPKFNCLIIKCINNRESLYDAINKRVDYMYNNGWIKEVQDLYNQYGNLLLSTKAFKAIGYTEILNAVINNTVVDLDLIKKKTRNLAKMQLTWCNNKFTHTIEYIHNKTNPNEIISIVRKFLYEN